MYIMSYMLNIIKMYKYNWSVSCFFYVPFCKFVIVLLKYNSYEKKALFGAMYKHRCCIL